MYWYSLVIEQANVTPLLFSCVPPCAPALNFVIAPAWPLWHFLYIPKCRGSHYTFCIIHSLKIRKLLILCYFNSNHYFCLMANTVMLLTLNPNGPGGFGGPIGIPLLSLKQLYTCVWWVNRYWYLYQLWDCLWIAWICISQNTIPR